MFTAITPPAESSPASVNTTVFAPAGDARAEWLKSGAIPETPKPEESATSKESSAEGDKPEGKAAPASEAGKQNQEQKQRSNADTRLNELLDDLRAAGLTPKALKTFTQEYERKQQQAEPQKAATEKTDNPASDLKAPVKPKSEDFEGKPWAEYEAAKDKYSEDLAEYKAKKAVDDFRQQQKQEVASRELRQKLTDAKTRYGDDAESTISTTAGTIFNDPKISGIVKSLVNESPVLVDVLYVLGEKAGDLQDFLGDARSNTAAAIRKFVLIEKLVIEDLAKGGGKTKAGEDDTRERGEDGKFKAAATPEKKTTDAPPPPREVSGRGPAPDEVEAAYTAALKSGDARAAIDAENRRDLRRRKGL